MKNLSAFLFLAAGAVLLQPRTDGAVLDKIFTFTGNCTIDCTGTATGTLTLSGGYVSGNAIAASFLSFQYASTFSNFTILSSDPGLLVFGSLPVTLPGAADITIFSNSVGDLFESHSDGSWCVNDTQNCSFFQNTDFGDQGGFASAQNGVPEPSSVLLVASGVAGLIFASKRRRS